MYLKTEEVTGDSWNTVLRIGRENAVVIEEIKLNKVIQAPPLENIIFAYAKRRRYAL